MKINFINPQSPFLFNQAPFPPLGILYIASAIKKYDPEIEIDIYDLAIESDPYDSVKKVANKDYDIYALTSTTPQYPYALKIANIIKNTDINSCIMIGGVHSTIIDFKMEKNVPHPKLYKKLIDSFDVFDVIFKGEAEDTFKNLLSRNLKNSRTDSSHIVIDGTPTKNIDIFPTRDLIDTDKYNYFIGKGKQKRKATQILSARGCPYRCNFCCGRNIKSLNTIRYRSIDNVLEELDHLNSKYGYNGFFFHDDEFNTNKKRTIELCNRLKERNYIYRAFVRSNLFDEEIAKSMHDTGFVAIGCGIESGSQRILDLINKKTTVKDNTRVVDLCKKYDMELKAFTIIGNLDETLDDIEKTKQWLINNKPDDFDLTIFTPYPGSNIYDNYYNNRFNFNKLIKIHPIDFTIEEEKTNYLGKKGEYRCYVSTPEVRREKLLELREKLDNDVCNELGIEHNALVK